MISKVKNCHFPKSLAVVFSIFYIFTLSACSQVVADPLKTPEIYEAAPFIETVEAENLYPLVYPDVDQGENLYIEECETCHGEAGRGDGEAASNLSMPAAPLGEKSVMRQTQPVRWYMHVTYGDIGHGMPGFNNRLDSRQRWDVVAYTTMLNYSESELEMGKTIFYESCESCHSGTTIKYASEVDGVVTHYWKDPAVLPRMSDLDIWEEVTQGIDQGMPSFESSLTEEERWAVTSYVRTLSYLGTMSLITNNEGTEPTPESYAVGELYADDSEVNNDEEQSPESSVMRFVNITGNVTRFNGAPLTGQHEAELLLYNSTDSSMKRDVLDQTDLDDNGGYQFKSIRVDDKNGDILFVKVDYDDTSFYSEPISLIDIDHESNVNQKIVVYDTSHDSSKLVAERWHIYLDYSNHDVINVLEIFIISNPSRKLIIPNESGDPILAYDLPENATNLQVSDDRYPFDIIQTENGFGDVGYIKPESNIQIAFSFEIPYEISDEFLRKSQQQLSLSAPLSVESVVVMKPNDEIILEDTILKEAGQQSMKGVEYQVYSANQIDEGSQLDINLTNRSRFNDLLKMGSTYGLILGITALILSVGVIYYSISRIKSQNRKALPVMAEENEKDLHQSPDMSTMIDELIDMIITLDDAYQAGNIPEDAYLKRRAELKNMIRQLKKETEEEI